MAIKAAQWIRFIWGFWLAYPLFDYVIIAFVAIVPFINVHRCGFAFDDHVAIANNRDVLGKTSLIELFTHDFWASPIRSELSHKSYRPLTTLSFRLTHLLFGMRQSVFHAENVLHCAFACFMFLRYLRVFLRRTTALLATMLFALHPVHVEAVTGTVGRAELLSAATFFVALYAYEKILQNRILRHSTTAAVSIDQNKVGLTEQSDQTEEKDKNDAVQTLKIKQPTGWSAPLVMAPLGLMAMFFKEQGVTFLGLLLALELWRLVSNRFFSSQRRGKESHENNTTTCAVCTRIAILVVISICLMTLRLYIMKGTLPQFKWYDNPALFQPTPIRQLTWLFLPVVNLRLLLSPFWLLCDYGMDTIPLVKSPFEFRFVYAVVLYASLAALLAVAILRRDLSRAQKTTVLIGVGLVVIPYIPGTNLLFPVGFVVAERVLYLSSAGWCLLVAYGGAKIMRRVPALSGFLLVYMVICGIRIYVRNNDWRSERDIFSSALRITWRNAKMFNNVGHTYESERKFDTALRYFRIASKSQPEDIGAWMNVARMYKNLRQLDKAEKIYVHACGFIPKPKPGETILMQLSPKELSVYVDLGDLISDNATRHEEAMQLAQYVRSMRPDFPASYRLISKLLSKDSKWSELESTLEKALPTLLHPDDELAFALAVAYRNLNKTKQALDLYEQTLAINAKHDRALNEWAQVVMRDYNFDFDRMNLAFVRLERAYQYAMERGGELAQLHAFVMANATALHRQDVKTALVWLKRAVEVDENFINAILLGSNLAYKDKFYNEALYFTTRLTTLQPENVKAWLVVGDLYLKQLNNAGAAQEAFAQAKKHEPNNLDAGLNYCSSFVMMKKLDEALACYDEFKKIIPSGDVMLTKVDGIINAINAKQFG